MFVTPPAIYKWVAQRDYYGRRREAWVSNGRLIMASSKVCSPAYKLRLGSVRTTVYFTAAYNLTERGSQLGDSV